MASSAGAGGWQWGKGRRLWATGSCRPQRCADVSSRRALIWLVLSPTATAAAAQPVALTRQVLLRQAVGHLVLCRRRGCCLQEASQSVAGGFMAQLQLVAGDGTAWIQHCLQAWQGRCHRLCARCCSTARQLGVVDQHGGGAGDSRLLQQQRLPAQRVRQLLCRHAAGVEVGWARVGRLSKMQEHCTQLFGLVGDAARASMLTPWCNDATTSIKHHPPMPPPTWPGALRPAPPPPRLSP